MPFNVQREIGGMALLIHNRGVGWGSVVCPTTRPLYARGRRPGAHYTGSWLAGPWGQWRQVRKISFPLGFEPRIFQPVAGHSSACAIAAADLYSIRSNFLLFCVGYCRLNIPTALRKSMPLKPRKVQSTSLLSIYTCGKLLLQLPEVLSLLHKTENLFLCFARITCLFFTDGLNRLWNHKS
jgi:hypothetical protein